MRGSEWRGLLVLLALLAAPAMADWKQDYARGLEAAKDGRWSDVERHMQSALADNPKPAERVRLYGQRYEAYVPQHYAGLAALRLGDCEKALAYWGQAGNAAIVSSVAALGDEESQGRTECSSRLVRQGQPAKTDAPSIAVEPPKPQAQPAPIAAPPTRPIVQAPAIPPPTDSRRESSSISAQILRPLLDAYLSGRYADVLKLSSKVPPSLPLRWHMLTVRAAAAYNLGRLGGTADATAIARQAADQARASDPALRPDPEYFSPEFIRFFSGR